PVRSWAPARGQPGRDAPDGGWGGTPVGGGGGAAQPGVRGRVPRPGDTSPGRPTADRGIFLHPHAGYTKEQDNRPAGGFCRSYPQPCPHPVGIVLKVAHICSTTPSTGPFVSEAAAGEHRSAQRAGSGASAEPSRLMRSRRLFLAWSRAERVLYRTTGSRTYVRLRF